MGDAQGDLKGIQGVIEQKVLVFAPADDVFAAMGTENGLDGWWTRGARIDLEKRQLRFRWREWGAEKVTGEDLARILRYEPPHALSFDWHAYGDDRVTRVDITIAPAERGVVLAVSDSGHVVRNEEDAARFAGVAAGWGEALALVKMYVEHGAVYDPIQFASGLS